MKRLLTAFAIVAVCASAAWPQAADKQSFFTGLRHKAERIIPVKKAAGGGEAVSAEELYWKGVKREASVGEEELEKFKSAVGLALQGKDEEAALAFEVFAREFPESPLRKDARDAMGMLKPDEPAEPAEPAE
jgi:TolA-binding protein